MHLCKSKGKKLKSLAFLNRLFLVPKTNNKWRSIVDLMLLNKFLNSEKFNMDTPESIRTSLQKGKWVMSIDFKVAYFHIIYTVHKIPMFSCPRSILPIQSSTVWSIHYSNRIHKGSRGSQTDSSKQGYKYPPVPRQLVGQSFMPPSLSTVCTVPSIYVSGIRLKSEHGKL